MNKGNQNTKPQEEEKQFVSYVSKGMVMNQSNIKFMPHLKGTGTGRGLYLIYSLKSDITSSAYTHLIDVFSGSLEKMFFDVVF